MCSSDPTTAARETVIRTLLNRRKPHRHRLIAAEMQPKLCIRDSHYKLKTCHSLVRLPVLTAHSR